MCSSFVVVIINWLIDLTSFDDQGNTLDEQIAVDDQRAKIEKEIARLEKQARAEKQPKKKFELVQQIRYLKGDIKWLV